MVLDAGALIAIERDDRPVLRLLDRLHARGGTAMVPATALAQVLRDPARQVAISRLLGRSSTTTVALDRAGAAQIGHLLRRSGTTDVVDAHVVLCAIQTGRPVATSDAGDLRRLHDGLRTIEV
jgi:hypothetical protein